MTLGELARVLGRRANLDACSVSPYIKLWVAAVVREIATLRPWSWMFGKKSVLLDSDGSYTFADGEVLWTDVDFRVAKDGILLSRVKPYEELSSTPEAFYLLSEGSRWTLVCPGLADQSVDVYAYFFTPPVFERDTDTHPVLIYLPALVTARLWWELTMHLGRADADKAMAAYTQLLDLLLKVYGSYDVLS
jgi:hypothetical protein